MVGDPYRVPRRAFCGSGSIAVIRSEPYLSVCRNRTAGDASSFQQLDTDEYNRFDVRASKAIGVGGGRQVEFIAQVFNLFGKDNLGGIDSGWTSRSGTSRSGRYRWDTVRQSLPNRMARPAGRTQTYYGNVDAPGTGSRCPSVADRRGCVGGGSGRPARCGLARSGWTSCICQTKSMVARLSHPTATCALVRAGISAGFDLQPRSGSTH